MRLAVQVLGEGLYSRQCCTAMLCCAMHVFPHPSHNAVYGMCPRHFACTSITGAAASWNLVHVSLTFLADGLW